MSNGSGGGDDGNWYGVDQKIKSVQVYNKDNINTPVDGAATKLVFFLWTGMMPYNEFPCRPWDGCSEKDFEAYYCNDDNNYCDVVSSRTEGSCVSLDDLIWPITDLALLKITPDFASQTCADGVQYMCDFTGNYPLGSIYYNHWYSTHDQYYYPDMKDYCTQGNINDLCVYTRLVVLGHQPLFIAEYRLLKFVFGPLFSRPAAQPLECGSPMDSHHKALIGSIHILLPKSSPTWSTSAQVEPVTCTACVRTPTIPSMVPDRLFTGGRANEIWIWRPR